MLAVCQGDHAPIVTYDKNNVKIVFHVGKYRPRPDVVVVAVSVTSINTSSVKAFTFQAAVPKVHTITHVIYYYGFRHTMNRFFVFVRCLQEGKTSVDFNKATAAALTELDYVQIIYIVLQADSHVSTLSLNFYGPDASLYFQPTTSKCWSQWDVDAMFCWIQL